MSNEIERPPDVSASQSISGGHAALSLEARTLGTLPMGARLILRGRKDWRDATVVALSPEAVTLSVRSPSGRTYRVRRPPDSPLSFDGSIPLLGEGSWRAGLARYDMRW